MQSIQPGDAEIRPLAKQESNPFRTLAVSAWGYKGAIASSFVNGGAGQVGPIGEALKRDRWGIHAGVSNPRLTVAAQYAVRVDEGEQGLNTPASPRRVVDSTGTVMSGYALFRPLRGTASKVHPLSVLARFDRVTTSTESDASYDFVIAGLVWDLSTRLSMSLDYQEATSREGSPVAPTRTWFAHFVARF